MSEAPKSLLDIINNQLSESEKGTCHRILEKLSKTDPIPDATACDGIFGIYTHEYMFPLASAGFASRAAWFGEKRLIPAVLDLERKTSTQFHKGALFYDTGLAHLLSGNEDSYEYFIAMADEEEFRKTGGAHKRGTINKRTGGLAGQTIKGRLQFACDLLNGKVAGCAFDFEFMTGLPPITDLKCDAWRLTLDPLHQFELLRIIHDTELFVGVAFPEYPSVRDNPFVMLRLAKALSHLAQWVESILTIWQGGGGTGLSEKLNQDKDFGKNLSNQAGGEKQFAGNNPKTSADANAELHRLLKELVAAPVGAERQWRLLRILYIVRNSTAHTIESNLDIYQNRVLVLTLLQIVFVSVFTISQLKGRAMP